MITVDEFRTQLVRDGIHTIDDDGVHHINITGVIASMRVALQPWVDAMSMVARADERLGEVLYTNSQEYLDAIEMFREFVMEVFHTEDLDLEDLEGLKFENEYTDDDGAGYTRFYVLEHPDENERPVRA